MPWCPKCKNEYQEGILQCADCGCELVDSIPEDARVPLTFGEENQMLSLKKYLEYDGLNDVVLTYDETEQVYEISIREDDRKRAGRLMKIFIEQEEARKAAGDNVQEEASVQKESPSSQVPYRGSAEKAEDNRSSAWTLLIVGGAGLVVLLLGMVGILPFHLTGTNKYMVYGIMSAMFILFIVVGAVSMKNSRIFARKAESENSLRQSLVKWCEESLDAAAIDGELQSDGELSEEELYFRRFEKMKEKLNHQFVNLDQGFLDNFIDEEYDKVFDK